MHQNHMCVSSDSEHLFLKEECGQSIVRLRLIAEKWTGRYFSV